MVSALPQRSKNTHHVSMIENYPATLEVLGEPIRQVDAVNLAFLFSKVIRGIILICLCVLIFFPLSETRDPSKCGKGLQE